MDGQRQQSEKLGPMEARIGDKEEEPDGARRFEVRYAVSNVWLTRLGILLLILVCWQLASGPILDPLIASSPSVILRYFWLGIVDGTILRATLYTLGSAFLGFLLGGAFALVLGYLAGVSKFWAAVVAPYVGALFAVPRIAFVPLLIIWIGVGQPLSIVVSAILVFFLLFYNTYYGV